MNILMYRWKAYNQYDIIRNLKARGHIVDEIYGDMVNFESDEYFAAKFCDAIDSKKYDMVFTVNFFPVISDICEKRGIRYVSWCCDSPISTMYNLSVFNRVNTIFTFDMVDQMYFQNMGAAVYYLPLCADTDRLDEVVTMREPGENYEAPVSFVGSMYNKNSYDEVYEHMPEYMKGYFDAVLKMQMNTYSEYLLDDALDGDMLSELSRYFKLAKSERSFSDLSLIFSTTVLSYKTAQLERKSVIADIARKHDINVYTDDESVHFVRAVNKGIADYWHTAPKVFCDSRINLNLTIKSIRSGIPLRVFDIMGSGGFCMTNCQKELKLFFKDGEDLVTFKNRQDMLDKIDYYLEHEDERREIARNGYNKIKAYHTYANRFDEMAQIIPGL